LISVGDKRPAESKSPVAESRVSGSDETKSSGNAAKTSLRTNGQDSSGGTATGHDEFLFVWVHNT